MKTITISSAGLVLWLCCAASGQNTTPPSTPLAGPTPPDAPAQNAQLRRTSPALTDRQVADIAQFQTTAVTRILGVNVVADGVIPQTIRARNPLQMISPLAPPEYGNGMDNVSVHPQTGQPDGIVFFRIKF